MWPAKRRHHFARKINTRYHLLSRPLEFHKALWKLDCHFSNEYPKPLCPPSEYGLWKLASVQYHLYFLRTYNRFPPISRRKHLQPNWLYKWDFQDNVSISGHLVKLRSPDISSVSLF